MNNWKVYLLAILVAIILSVIITWPFAANLNSYSTDQGDYVLGATVLWYNQDSIITGRIFTPEEYWKGYQFYPQPLSLAFANNMIVPSLIFAPIFWITHNFVLSTNIFALLTLILSFLTAFYFIRYFLSQPFTPGESKPTPGVVLLAALVGAAVFAFNPVTLVRFPQHLDIQNKYFLPLVFLFAYKFFSKPSWKNGFLLSIFFTLNALSVNYFQIFSIVMLPIIALPFIIGNIRRGDWGGLGRLGRYGLIGVVFLPVLLYFNLTYLNFSQKEGVVRHIEETEFFAARFIDWIGTASDSLLYGGFMKSIFPLRSPIDNRGILNYEEHTLFLNILPIILFILGFMAFRKEKIPHKPFFYILLFVPTILMFGPYTPFFSWLFELVPFMKGIRSPTRFEFIMLVPFSLICAYGVSVILERSDERSSRWRDRIFRSYRPSASRMTIIVILLSLIVLENLTVRDYSDRSQTLAEIEKIGKENLAFLESQPTLHLPIYNVSDADVFGKNSGYLNWLTQTKEKIMNGNASYLPPDQLMFLDEISQNPEAHFEKLSVLGIKYVIVHKKDADVQIIDLSKFAFKTKLCDFENDFEKVEVDESIILTNKADCYLPNIYQDRYRSINGKIFRMPLLISPKEQVVVEKI